METGWLFFDKSAYHSDVLFLGNATSDHRGAMTMISMEENGRPFLSTGEDDEYYEEQFQEKKRRLTPEQVHLLEKSFEEENKLEPERKTQLAKNLSLPQRQVAVWFQNRRARWKAKQLERDYDVLKTSFDYLFSKYNAAVKDNENLKSEVVSLTEKLQAKEMEEAPVHAPNSKQPPAKILTWSGPQLGAKIDDGSSSGSRGSGVIEEYGPQISGDSFFVGNGAAPAEDDGRESRRICCENGWAAAEQQNNEGVLLHGWDWS